MPTYIVLGSFTDQGIRGVATRSSAKTPFASNAKRSARESRTSIARAATTWRLSLTLPTTSR
jgi:hypothetical protein